MPQVNDPLKTKWVSQVIRYTRWPMRSPGSGSGVPAPCPQPGGDGISVLQCGLTKAIRPLRWPSGGTEITRTPNQLRVRDGKAALLACEDPVKALLLLPRGSEGPPDPSPAGL